MAFRSRVRIASVGVAAVAGFGLLGIAAGPASAGGADPTAAGGGGAASAAALHPASVTSHRYIAHLVGCCEYHFKVSSNHTATSSFIPPDGFVGTWTWVNNSGTVTFTETNGAGCIWTAKKTKSGYASAAHPGVANCGTVYQWYTTKH